MENEEIFVCKAINNKTVRYSQLNILRKLEKEMAFEFGKDEANLKKRYYDSVEAMESDFNKLLEKKKSMQNKEEEEKDKINNENDKEDKTFKKNKNFLLK